MSQFWGLLVILLLVLRIPAVRRGASSLRQRLASVESV